DCGAEDGLAPEQGTAGAAPEALSTGEDEDNPGTTPWQPSPRHATDMRLAAQEGVEGLDELVPAGDDQRQPVGMVPPTCAGRVGQVNDVRLARATSQGVADCTCEVPEGGGSSRRERDDNLLGHAVGAVDGANRLVRRRLFQDDVRVRAAEPERADSCDR